MRLFLATCMRKSYQSRQWRIRDLNLCLLKYTNISCKLVTCNNNWTVLLGSVEIEVFILH